MSNTEDEDDVCDKCVEFTDSKCEHGLCSGCCGCTGGAEYLFEDR